MEFGKIIYYCAVILPFFAIQTVRSSPLNSIQDSTKDDLSPCSYDCSAKEGFCKNGGVCLKVKNTCSSSSYVCACPPGYGGERCDQVVAPCKYDQLLKDNCGCNNGATCRKVDSLCARESYRCDCKSGFEGPNCEFSKVDETLPQQSVTLTSPTLEIAVAVKDSQPENASDVFDTNSSSPQLDLTLPTSIPSTPIQDMVSTTLLAKGDDVTTTTAASNDTTNMATKTYGLEGLLSYLEPASDTHRNKCPGCLMGRCEKSKCVCYSGYVGKNCEKKETVDGQVSEVVAANTSQKEYVAGPFASSNDTVEWDEGDCYRNFKCKHGVCNKTDPERPRCICDEGYVGAFCQIACSKECLNGGVCTVYEGTEKCACRLAFTGEFCNETNEDPNLPNPETPGDNVCSDKLVCVRGECDKSNPGKHRCRCHEGFTGDSCDTPCSKVCQNGGECRVNSGLESCHCPKDLGGEFCQEVVNASTAPPETSSNNAELGLRLCTENFRCVHGVCDKTNAPEFRCLCDEGYTGMFCHIQCTKPCKNGGKCLIYGGREACQCPSLYTGELCETKLTPLKPVKAYDINRARGSAVFENGPANKRSVASKAECAKLCPKGERCVLSAGEEKCEQKRASITFKALSRFLLRSKTQRSSRHDPKKCFSNFICVHGVCDNSDPWRPRCVCDDGFVGAFCHQQCSLQCSNGGRCIVLTGQQYCNCKYGYSGAFCEKMIYFDKAKVEKQTGMNETSETTTTEPSTTGEPA